MHYSMVYYFASHQPITDRMLFHAFMHGDDAYRGTRLTLLPNIPNVSGMCVVDRTSTRGVNKKQISSARICVEDSSFLLPNIPNVRGIPVNDRTSSCRREQKTDLVRQGIYACVEDLTFLVDGLLTADLEGWS